MKKCPCCGYVPSPTNRQILNLYRREFGDEWATTIYAMVDRGWITLGSDEERANVTLIQHGMKRFFELEPDDDLREFLAEPQFPNNTTISCILETA